MIGKKIKVNDYKFTYGQDTIYINIYGAFKNKKNGNKYAIYSYENNSKIFYGNFFIRDKEAVIMLSKENPIEVIKEFVDEVISEKLTDKFEILSLEAVNTIQIIDECALDYNVDVDKLYDLTIPKPVIEETEEPPKDKKISIAPIFFGLFIIVIIAFFFVNPEVIMGKNKQYVCTKSYFHDKLPASVNEETTLTFNGQGKIIEIAVMSDYVFIDTNYYQEFKEKSHFYQYFEEGDTYKFNDNAYTYRLFSQIDITSDYFLPEEETELVSHYKENNYICKVVEIDE